MSFGYRPVRTLEGLLALVDGVGVNREVGRQLWARSRMRSHRTSPCANCGREIGAEGYRPLASPTTGTRNRYDRLCLHCVEDYAAPSV